MKKSKIVSLALAGTLTVTALLAGTYAWTSISQQAMNEVEGSVNPGGRLHDDFNGTNKDIYVENFTSKEEDGAVIYARIKLAEYLSVGEYAGTDESDKNVIPPEGVSAEDAPEYADKTTWATYKLEDGDSSIYRSYFGWKWGSTEDGGTEYLPTFNKNKDSLEADINGTLAGTDGDKTQGIAYDDYVVYKIDADTANGEVGSMSGLEIYDADSGDTESEDINLNQLILAAMTKKDTSGNIIFDTDKITKDTTAISVAINGVTDSLPVKVIVDKQDDSKILEVYVNIDKDKVPDSDPEEEEYDIKIIPNSEAHAVKATLTTTDVITMDEWKLLGSPKGPYWVYDSDGWAYWAQGIEPGTATGCLLTGIERSGTISSKYYYAINVTAEFATAGDWGDGKVNTAGGTGFYKNKISEDGLYLLNTIAGNEKKLIVSSKEYATAGNVKPGTSIVLSGKVMLGDTEMTDNIEWTVSDHEDKANTTITATSNTEAKLTVGANETAQIITVTACIKGTDVTQEKTIKVGKLFDITAAQKDADAVAYVVPENFNTMKLMATVKDQRGDNDYSGIKWELDGTYKEGTGIATVDGNSYEAVLTVADTETADQIVVKATSLADESVFTTYSVELYTQVEYVEQISSNAAALGLKETTVKIDGINWYVLARQDANEDGKEEALLWAANVAKGWGGPNETTGRWQYWSKEFPFRSETLEKEMLALGDADKTDDIENTEYNEEVTKATNWWKYSNVRAWLNSDAENLEVDGRECDGFLFDKSILSDYAVEVTIKTRREFNQAATDASNYEPTDDRVFLLTEADVYGTDNKKETTEAINYTAGEKLLKEVLDENGAEINKSSMLAGDDRGWYALRSPFGHAGNIAIINYDKESDGYAYGGLYWRIRPALWLNLSSSSQTESDQ